MHAHMHMHSANLNPPNRPFRQLTKINSFQNFRLYSMHSNNNNTQKAAIASPPSATHPQLWVELHIHVHISIQECTVTVKIRKRLPCSRVYSESCRPQIAMHALCNYDILRTGYSLEGDLLSSGEFERVCEYLVSKLVNASIEAYKLRSL